MATARGCARAWLRQESAQFSKKNPTSSVAYHRRQATEVLFPKIRRLWDEGVKFCINSDDPTYMHNVWIDGNMMKVYEYCQFTKRDMAKLVQNAVEMSWADEDIKKEILRELESTICQS